MYFVCFYSCWNEFLKFNNMQVFVFVDRVKDVNVIVVVWCGMEFFNVMDWSIDFDFLWYYLEGMGNVYVGFLEVFGFVNCNDKEFF